VYNTGRRYNTGHLYNRILLPWHPVSWYDRLGFAVPVVVNRQMEPVALLHDAYEIIVHQTLGNEDRLEFKLPVKPGAEALETGTTLDLAGSVYRVMVLTNEEDDAGARYWQVEAWALWYDLLKAPDAPAREWENVVAAEVLSLLLSGTGWQAGDSPASSIRPFVFRGGCNRLEALREMERIFQVELDFQTKQKTVSLRDAAGEERNVFFLRGKNLRRAQEERNAIEQVTRVYPRGRGGLTIATVNNGISYLEVESGYDPPPSAVLTAEEFTDPNQLKEYAQAYLLALSQAQVSYECGIVDLSALAGYEGEKVSLGDVVTVYDEDSGIYVKTRVMRMRYFVEEPWRSEIELAAVRKDLSETLSQVKHSVALFDTADMVDKKDIEQLSVFNLLLNSRAESGTAYWINDGWTVDGTQGYSGGASFKAVGALGASKTLTQTVHPAHRDSYVLSLRAVLENIQLGPNGKVGVEIVIHYEDGSSETQFVSLVLG
jgi:phage minor structural protein